MSLKKIKPNELGSVLKGLSELAAEDFTVVLQKLSVDAFRELVRRSATDTGYLRSNWSLTTAAPPEDKKKNPGGSFSAAQPPNVSTIEIDDKVVIYNNTEYAIYLENGTAKMRAQPMVQPTYYRIYSKAVELSKAFSKRKYDV